MGYPALRTANTQNLDRCPEMVLAVRRMTNEAILFVTVRTPTTSKQLVPVILKRRKAIVSHRNVE